jgi:hypothetical protein
MFRLALISMISRVNEKTKCQSGAVDNILLFLIRKKTIQKVCKSKKSLSLPW